MCFGTMCVLTKDYWWGKGVFRGEGVFYQRLLVRKERVCFGTMCVFYQRLAVRRGEGVFWDDVCVD